MTHIRTSRHECTPGEEQRAFSRNRDAYILQSSMTKGGVVAQVAQEVNLHALATAVRRAYAEDACGELKLS